MTDEELLDIVRTVSFDDFGDRDRCDRNKADKLVMFFLKYGRQVCPKDVVMTKWKEAQQKKHEEDPAAELMGDFNCLVDYQSDVESAAAVWHFVNSYKDWTAKYKNPYCKKTKHGCFSRFTYDRRARRVFGEDSINEEGRLLFTEVLEWSRKMKKGKNYKEFKCMINLRAKDLMILPPLENNDGKAKSVKKALEDMREEGVTAKKIQFGSGCCVEGLDDVIGSLVRNDEEEDEEDEE